MTWSLLVEGSGPQVMRSFEDIETAIQQAMRHAQATHGYPTLVELSLDDESTMAIVVGGEWSYAAFQYNPRGPRFFSHNQEGSQMEGTTPFIFMQFGSQGEMDLEYTVSPAKAVEALRLYFTTRMRPQTIPWDGYSTGDT